MPKATWNGAVIAEAPESEIEMVEGNVYFPPTAVNREHLQANSQHTTCPWKGVASYYDVVVGDQTNSGAAWYYPTPKEAAKNIKDYVAFWNGVTVER